MSGGERPNWVRGAVALPSPEEAAREPRGVVFYRVGTASLSMADTLGAIASIAQLAITMGPGRGTSEPYEMRVGFKWEDDGRHYWVGFNHEAFGAMYEQRLRAAEIKYTRRDRQRLGERASNKVLSIADPAVLEAKQQELLGSGRRNQPRRQASVTTTREVPAAQAEKPAKVDPFRLMREKRAELSGTSFGQRLRRGMRRRGDAQTDEQP